MSLSNIVLNSAKNPAKKPARTAAQICCPQTDYAPYRRLNALIPLTAALVLACASAQAAVGLHVLNLAPRDASSGGTLRVEIASNGTTTKLPDLLYKAKAPLMTMTSAEFEVTVRDELGAVKLIQQLSLPDGRDSVIAVVGNGATQPLQLFVQTEHAWFFQDGFYSLQANWVAPLTSGADLLETNVYTRECSQPERAPTFQNNAEIGDSLVSNRVRTFRSPATSCQVLESAALYSKVNQRFASNKTFAVSSGERIRAFIVGDNIHQPLETLIFSFAIEATKPVVESSQSMEGWWYNPQRPGEAFSVLFDPSATGNAKVTLMMYSHSREGDPRWFKANSGQLVELIGGSADGANPATTKNLGSFSYTFHSCSELSINTNLVFPSQLRLTANELAAYVKDRARGDNKSTTFVKLLPLENCSN